MLAYRVIARLDIKGANLIKGVQFEGLRVLGEPGAFAARYAASGADELLYFDSVASLYGRNQLTRLIEATSAEAFVPLTVGGGIGSVEMATEILRTGADKLAVNTAALKCPGLIDALAAKFGSQAVCLSVEAKRVNGGWEAMTEGGRIPSGRSVLTWIAEAVERGAGEVLVTSVDCDGTRCGPDFDLIEAIGAIDVPVPFVYCGGIRLRDVEKVARHTDGMAVGAALHYGDCTIADIKAKLAATQTIRIDIV